ncbi:MAG: YkvA family protein [bacterium]
MSRGRKRKIIAGIIAVLYVLWPLDILPEWVLGPLGFLDDLGVVAWAIWEMRRPTGEETKDQPAPDGS